MIDKVLPALDSWRINHGYEATKIEVRRLALIADAKTLTELLDGWKTASGWVARQSGVEVWPLSEPSDALGDVVEAELTVENETIQVRRTAAGWMATLLTQGDGDDCLSEEVCHVTVGNGAAKYLRYWSLLDDGACEIIAWRFAGFEGMTDAS